jgi:hypothetical protein
MPGRYDSKLHFKRLLDGMKKVIASPEDGRLGIQASGQISDNDLGDLLLGVAAHNTHVAYEKYGRPTYLVSRDLFDCVGELDVSEQDMACVFERLPYPCFSLVFETGIYDDRKAELQSLFISKEHDVFPMPQFVDGIMMPIYVGHSCPGILTKIGADRNTMSAKAVFGKITPSTLDRLWTLRRCAAALVMLWRSRPEFVVNVLLPRAERYNFKGDRKLIRTWKFPDKLIVRKPHGESEPTGRHVKAHWRAGHFRHYRHERYERELDGSAKIEFIAPCVIHADELSKESGHGT